MGNVSAQSLILRAKELCWSVSPEPDPKVGKRRAMRKQLAVESVVKVI